jgi:hypothetical protein
MCVPAGGSRRWATEHEIRASAGRRSELRGATDEQHRAVKQAAHSGGVTPQVFSRVH